MSQFLAVQALLLLGVVRHTYASSPGSQYVLSPSSRTILPKSIDRTSGNVSTSGGNVSGPVVLNGPGATVTYDFGQMVAGIPRLTFGTGHCSSCNTLGLPGYTCGSLCSGLGLSYTESARFIGIASDNSTLYSHPDGTVYLPVSPGTYTVPSKWQRGSFRYLTLSMPSAAKQSHSVTVSLDRLAFTAQPSLTNPSRSAGYFVSSDDLLNRVWHAAAYTVQLSTVAANSSVQHTFVLSPVGWEESAQADGLSATDEYLSDGAKRDRNPWSADLAIGIRSSVVTQADLTAIKNSLKAYLAIQDPISGYFPYAGSPFGNFLTLIGLGYASDTYHLWTILGYADYVLASGDTAFGRQYWGQIDRGISATYQYLDSATGLFNGTRDDDWGRIGQGGQNTALNALYYQTLLAASKVRSLLGQDGDTVSQDLARAARVKHSLNALLFDSSRGLFWDNTTAAGHAIHPQDGNVLAVLFNVTDSTDQTSRILRGLATRHTRYGALAPEFPGAISPFITGLELYARFQAQPGDVATAMSQIRTQWKYMLDAFSNSTLIEGYASDGSLNYPFYPAGSGFISHTHTWSTGPLYVLSARLAGLRASGFDVAEDDGDWVFQPSAFGSGVKTVSAGFRRPAGEYSVDWTLSASSFRANIGVPGGSQGTIHVPSLGRSKVKKIVIDGGAVSGTVVNGFVRVGNVAGGKHTIYVEI